MPLQGPHIIVGLGNPGREYEDTRHNAGFLAVDAIAAELGVGYWKTAANALVAECNYMGERLLLVKPQSYMNLSGGPVKGLRGRYDFETTDVLVIHDELDLPQGSLRLKIGGGHAGHNGLRSLHQSIGADYARMRIGIGRPEGRMPAHTYVLQRLRLTALEEFKVDAARAADMVLMAVRDGVQKTMNVVNAASLSAQNNAASLDTLNSSTTNTATISAPTTNTPTTNAPVASTAGALKTAQTTLPTNMPTNSQLNTLVSGTNDQQ